MDVPMEEVPMEDETTDDIDVGFVLYLVRGIVAICVASLVVAIARMLMGRHTSRVAEGVAIAVGMVVVLLAPVLIAARARREPARREPARSDTAQPVSEHAERMPSDPPAVG